MTTWYREGLVTLTSGSDLVAGVGTEWVDNVLPGGIFFTPTGLVEVERVISDSSLKMVIPYAGPTVAAAEYAIAPTQGYVVDLAKQVNAVLGTFGELKDAWQDGSLVGKGLALKGVKNDVGELPATGNVAGDAWMVDGHMHVWSGTVWKDEGATVSTPELEALRDAAGTSAGLAIGSALAADTTRKDYEDRVYPGVYSSAPTNKPHSGAPAAQGDRCTILVGGVAYEHLRSGGGWLIPNVDAAALAMANGAARVGTVQPEAGAVQRTLEEIARERPTADGYATLQAAADAKRGAASTFRFQPKQYVLGAATLNMRAYLDIKGAGDASQVKLAAGGGIVYQNAVGVFDDHPHKILAAFRITGDGAFADWPAAQNGTTTGFANAVGAHFLHTSAMTFELHAIGRLLTNNYTSHGSYNYFRANKIGAKFDGVTSYTERNSYFRYNSEAAVLVTGATQNFALAGGALENNYGRAIWTTGMSPTTPFTMLLDDEYLEGNGNQAGNVPAVDVERGDRAAVLVRGGSLKQNVVGTRINGEYRWGSRVVFEGVALGGRHFADTLALRNDCDISDDTSFNTLFTAATGLARGLVEPAYLTDFSVRYLGIAPFGACFQVPLFGKAVRKLPFENLAAAAFPHIASKSASVTVTENAAAGYGDGSWSEITFPAAGDFNTNYVTLQSFNDASSASRFRMCAFLIRPEADVDIGLVSSGTAQNMAAFFKLKAGVTYRLLTMKTREAAGITHLRMFSLQESPPKVLFMPHSSFMFATLRPFASAVRGVIAGAL